MSQRVIVGSATVEAVSSWTSPIFCGRVSYRVEKVLIFWLIYCVVVVLGTTLTTVSTDLRMAINE